MRRIAAAAAGLALALFTACEEPTQVEKPQGQTPASGEPQRFGPAKALVEITIAGVPNATPTATARVLSSGRYLNQGDLLPAGNGNGPARSAAMDLRLGVLDGDGSIQLDPISTGSFTVGTRAGGGYRYVNATYRVRNAHADQSDRENARKNLTFLAVSTAGTINGTAFSQLNKFSGGAASAAIAPNILPTGWGTLNGIGEFRSVTPDVLQAYDEAEVGFPPPGGVTSIFPYGFVVRNLDTYTPRWLSAFPAGNQFDGVVTFAYKIPLQATATQDPFTVSAMFLAVDDDETSITQSQEEADYSAMTWFRYRADSLGATKQSFLAGGLGTGIEPVCGLRTAGLAGSPTAKLRSPSLVIVGIGSVPGVSSFERIDRNSALFGTYCDALGAADHTTMSVHASHQGHLFGAEGYDQTNPRSIATPSHQFHAGEEIEQVITSTQLADDGRPVQPYVRRYRAATDVATGPLVDSVGILPAGLNAHTIATGDFNEDGKLDAVTGSIGSGEIHVFLGGGNGTFADASGSPFAGPVQTFKVVVGDINGDDNLDIVATGYGDTNLGVLLGNGTGGFTAGTAASLGALNGRGLALADVNGDTNLDAVVGTSDGMVVLLGDGDGCFGAPIGPVASLNGELFGVVVGEFTGDVNLDAAVVNLSTNQMVTLTGDGSGAFTVLGSFTTLDGPLDLATADINGDDNLDVVTVNATIYSITPFLGDGAGGFTEGSTVGISLPTGIVLKDVTGDDIPDAILSGQQISSVMVMTNNGDGTFSGPDFYYTHRLAGPRALALGDFNGDGRVDAVTADYDSNSMTFMQGTGYQLFSRTPLLFNQPSTVAIGDINHNGRLDMVIADRADNWVTVALNTGSSFAPWVLASGAGTGSAPLDILLADFNDDGWLDAATANAGSDNVTILTNTGSFGFSPLPPVSVGSNPVRLARGDFNRDGHVDLAVLNASGSITLLVNDGAANFTPQTASDNIIAGVTDMAVGDFNRDGALDLAVTNLASEVLWFLLGDGQGNFGINGIGITAPRSLAIADFNHDGCDDILVGQGLGSVTLHPGDCQGNYSYNPSPTLVLGGGPDVQRMTAADANGDGNMDAVVTAADNQVHVLYGDGAGNFSESTFMTGYEPMGLDVGDLNDDGKLDVITADPTSRGVSTLIVQ